MFRTRPGAAPANPNTLKTFFKKSEKQPSKGNSLTMQYLPLRGETRRTPGKLTKKRKKRKTFKRKPSFFSFVCLFLFIFPSDKHCSPSARGSRTKWPTSLLSDALGFTPLVFVPRERLRVRFYIFTLVCSFLFMRHFLLSCRPSFCCASRVGECGDERHFSIFHCSDLVSWKCDARCFDGCK